MMSASSCPLCLSEEETILWRDALLRIIQVHDPDYPGFCRVVLNRHIKEMTDLSIAEREQLMQAVFAVEAVLRQLLAPDKINLASLGNQVPHLHWHVIPRFADDAHFPDPIWGERRHASPARALDTAQLKAALAQCLGVA